MYPLMEYKHIFVLDPFDDNKESIKQAIIEEMTKLKREYQIIDLDNLAYIEDYVSKLSDCNNVMVHSVGNSALDNVIINGLVHKKIILNLFYKYNDLKKGESKINLGRINNRYFYSGVMIGIDANVDNYMFKEFSKNQSKRLTYLNGNLKELLKFKAIKLFINEHSYKLTNLYIGANGDFANVHFKDADNLYNTRLDYGVIKRHGRLFLAQHLLKKEFKICNNLNSNSVKELEIITEKPVIVDYDGMKLYSDEINVTIEPRCLKLYYGDPYYINYKVERNLKKFIKK